MRVTARPPNCGAAVPRSPLFRQHLEGTVRHPNARGLFRSRVRHDSLGTATWVHADQDTPAPALVMPLPSVDANHVLLIVEEGDNTLLPISGARLLLPAYRMRLFRAPGQSLRLAYGRTDLSPPSYDLALLAPRVFGVSAVDVPPGPEREGRAGGAAALISPRLFWVILIGAVIVLLGLIARLVRKPTV